MEKSTIEIRLYNHENGKEFYKDLTIDEFIAIAAILEVDDVDKN